MTDAVVSPTDTSAAPAAVSPSEGAAPAIADVAAPASPTAEVAAPAAPVDATPAPAPVAVETAVEKTEAPKLDAAPSLLTAADAKSPADAPKDAKAVETPAPDATSDAAKAAAEAAAKTDPAKDATAPAPPAPLTYEPFKVPEGIKLDETMVKQFTDIIGPKQLPQEQAQNLIDLAQNMISSERKRIEDYQRDVWNKVGETWASELRDDPDLGRNRLNTTLSIAKAVVEEYAGNQSAAKEILALMDTTKLGNNKQVVGLLHNIGKALNVFEDKIVTAQPTAPKRQKSPGNRGWYESMEQG